MCRGDAGVPLVVSPIQLQDRLPAWQVTSCFGPLYGTEGECLVYEWASLPPSCSYLSVITIYPERIPAEFLPTYLRYLPTLPIPIEQGTRTYRHLNLLFLESS